MIKWVLRSLSTSAVVMGAVALAYVAPPPIQAPQQPAPAMRAAGSISLIGKAQARPAGPRKADLSSYVPADPDQPWAPPPWFGAEEALWTLGQMDSRWEGGDGPPVKSRSVFVFDVDAGKVLFEKNADNVRPVASITKLMSSLALVSAEPDLETEFCIGAEQYPTRSGAISRLSTGDCISGWDTLGAALVASDNRGAYGMATAAGMDIDRFVERMNSVSDDLGMSRSSWSDPSGLEDENLSTARDIAKATFAVASHPVLRSVASAPFWDLHRSNRNSPRRLYSTDRMSGREDIVIEAAKTGYTDTARYCFTTMLTTEDGRRLVVTLLGADGKMTRWADMERILNWVQTQG
ncbi:MAG TPA: hypothetical protein PKY30_08175 [Myxococcota bacterium]|nr:hypothetical protein [Myxococcota bacterium]HND31454.1 hypothetical protein [Myxococcota bacterium]HNH46999.1 hypothetical protein [Myxococcota bacterium]